MAVNKSALLCYPEYFFLNYPISLIPTDIQPNPLLITVVVYINHLYLSYPKLYMGD